MVEIPWTERAIGKDEVAVLIGCQPDSVLRLYACKPDFPRPIQRKPARWVAREVLEWRDRRRAA
jgi:predicted DNA-binding transcriptional regulator AlpA